MAEEKAEERTELEDLLEDPVGTITIRGKEFRIYPAGLPETRDFQRGLARQRIQAGDELPIADRTPPSAQVMEFMTNLFWLLIRQGSPDMTPQRVLEEDWEVSEKAAARLCGWFRAGLSEGDMDVQHWGVKAGLVSEEAVDVMGEMPSVTATLELPPQSEEQPSGEQAEPTGDSSSPDLQNTG